MLGVNAVSEVAAPALRKLASRGFLCMLAFDRKPMSIALHPCTSAQAPSHFLEGTKWNEWGCVGGPNEWHQMNSTRCNEDHHASTEQSLCSSWAVTLQSWSNNLAIAVTLQSRSNHCAAVDHLQVFATVASALDKSADVQALRHREAEAELLVANLMVCENQPILGKHTRPHKLEACSLAMHHFAACRPCNSDCLQLMRCKRTHALQQRLASADAVQAHIDAQEQDVLRRLEALHAELALVREKKEEQALKVEGVREEHSRRGSALNGSTAIDSV
eukprot:91079-Pelagomonas_calceolata.AAC.4